MKSFTIIKLGFLLLILCISFTSCKIMYPSIMFKSKGIENNAQEARTIPTEYIIHSGDRMIMQVYSNDGYELVNVMTSTISGAANVSQIEYQVNLSGNVKLPLLDTVYIKGSTVREAEKMMEKKYAKYFKDPFVVIKITNKRVIIFSGEGRATVVPFENQNMSLIEALAKAGGIAATGKAYHIKLIRGDLSNPEVRIIDLSSIEGMKEANLVLQANDIIYVEPVIKITTGVLNEITPIIGLLSAITSILLIFNLLKN